MKISYMVVAGGLFAIGATLFGVGCGSDPSVTCSVTETVGPVTVKTCETVTAASGSDVTQDDLNALCKSPGKIVDSCPTAGLIGTCTYAASGGSYAIAYYSGTASADETACKLTPKATWKAK